VRQADLSLESQNVAAELRIRAQRKAGELLREMPPHPPGPDRSTPVTDLPPTLAQVGITKNQSSAWKRIADIPADDFEEHISETKAAGARGGLY
jgi:hypothetical protein